MGRYIFCLQKEQTILVEHTVSVWCISFLAGILYEDGVLGELLYLHLLLLHGGDHLIGAVFFSSSLLAQVIF
jgi:hypothetical protein